MKTKKKPRRWSQNEIDFVGNAYGHVPIKMIADKLGRSYDAVRWQAKLMSVTQKNYEYSGYCDTWSEEDDQYLSEYYHKVPTKFIMMKLKKSAQSLRNRARKLGVAKTQWMPDKVKSLQKNLGTKSIDKICKFFEDNA